MARSLPDALDLAVTLAEQEGRGRCRRPRHELGDDGRRGPHPAGRAVSAGTSPRPARSYRRLFALLVLVGEALVVGFATLVAKDLADVTRVQALAAGGVLALLCVLAAGLLRSPAGYLLGAVV